MSEVDNQVKNDIDGCLGLFIYFLKIVFFAAPLVILLVALGDKVITFVIVAFVLCLVIRYFHQAYTHGSWSSSDWPD